MDQPQPTIHDILNVINSIKNESTYDALCPSIGTTISLFPLNAEHQKNLVKSLVDSPQFSTVFNITMFAILQDVTDKSIDVGSLNILDKQFLLLSLRANNIGETVEQTFTTSEGNEFKKNIDLLKHLNKKSKIKNLQPIDVKANDSYSATLAYPTLKDEFLFDKLVHSKLSTIDDSNVKSLKGLISFIFITNILQYINTLTIGDAHINFRELSITDRMSIGEKLPTTLTQLIINKIDTYFGKTMKDVLEYSFVKDGETISGELVLDNSFFLSS